MAWLSTLGSSGNFDHSYANMYENLQRVRILVDDISLYENNWNRALRLESYLNSSRQQQATKRGEMSQILHVM